MYFCEKFCVRLSVLCKKCIRCIHTYAYLTTKIQIVCEITILLTDFLTFKLKFFMTSLSKQEIRRAVRVEIKKLSPEERESISTQIFNNIELLPELQGASVIALFASLHDEPQTAKFIEHLSHYKRVVLPRISGEDMDFYDTAEGLCEGAFGIMEPTAATPIEPSEIDLMIVPGVAFTREGARCGRGKGFYDKYLAHEGFRAYTIGVCYPCQIVDTLPTEPHDRVLDRVVY